MRTSVMDGRIRRRTEFYSHAARGELVTQSPALAVTRPMFPDTVAARAEAARSSRLSCLSSLPVQWSAPEASSPPTPRTTSCPQPNLCG
ncbi:hypothetical protein MRX96_026953 [Rhipicephalus microplus]